MTDVWRIQGLSGTEKLVLLALADNANDAGECFPSMSMLAQKTCVCERAVRNAIRDLEAAGYVSSASRAGTSTLYRIHTTPAPNAAPARRAPRHQMPPTPAPDAPPPRHVVPPTPARGAPITISEPSSEPSLNQKTTRSKSAPVDWVADLQARGVDRVVAESWLQVRKSKNAAVTVVAVDGIQREAQKSGLPLDDVLRMCCERGWAGFKASWLNEQPRGSPALTGRDASRAAAAKAFFGDMNHEPRIIDVTPTTAGALGCKDFP